MPRRRNGSAFVPIFIVLVIIIGAVVFLMMGTSEKPQPGPQPQKPNADEPVIASEITTPAVPETPAEPAPETAAEVPVEKTPPVPQPEPVSLELVPMPTEELGANLVPNGDLETMGGEAIFKGWGFSKGRAGYALSKAPGRNGGSCARITAKGEDRAKFQNASSPAIAPAGAWLRVSVWVKCDNLKGGAFGAYEGEPREGWARFEIGGGTHDWKEYVHRVKMPGPAGKQQKMQLWFYVYGYGDIYFDDFAVQVINNPDAAEQARRENDKVRLAAARRIAAKLNGGTDPGWALGIADPVTKVFRDELFRETAAEKVSISLARDEYEAAQVVVLAPDKKLENVRITVQAPAGEGGVLSSFGVNPIGYVNTAGQGNKWPEKMRKIGWTPDPVLPPRTFTVAKGTCQPVLITFYADREQPAGVYAGKIKVDTANAGSLSMDLSVRVYGFVIPRTGHLRTFAWVPERKGQRNQDLYFRNRMPEPKAAIGFSWNKALFPRQGDGYDFSKADKVFEKYLARGATTFIIASVPSPGKWGFPKQLSAKWKADFKHLVTAYWKHLKSKGWDKYAFIYNIDEAVKKHWPACKDMYTLVKSIDKDIPVVQCLNVVGGMHGLTGFVDKWNLYVAQHDRQAVDSRRGTGEEIWWALCIWPSERPQAYVDYNLIDQRILGWMCWKYEIASFDHWALCDWKKGHPVDGSWAACPDGILTTQWKFVKHKESVDYVCYPFDNNKPISSLRFEAMRDAWEDYEYLWLLKQALPKLSGADKAEAEKILAVREDVVFSKGIFTEDTEMLLKLRNRAAELIEKAK